MLFKTLLAFLSAIALARSVGASATCTKQQRLHGAKLIPYSYNLKPFGASAKSFQNLPVAPDCATYINANGAPGVEVANSGKSTIQFAINTRQAFSKVTSTYTDYNNGTTILHANITLGALHQATIPVTFSADVFLFYRLGSCLIREVRAYATIPTEVGGQPIDPPIIDTLTSPSPLS